MSDTKVPLGSIKVLFYYHNNVTCYINWCKLHFLLPRERLHPGARRSLCRQVGRGSVNVLGSVLVAVRGSRCRAGKADTPAWHPQSCPANLTWLFFNCFLNANKIYITQKENRDIVNQNILSPVFLKLFVHMDGLMRSIEGKAVSSSNKLQSRSGCILRKHSQCDFCIQPVLVTIYFYGRNEW